MNILRKQLAYTLILFTATAPVQSATTDLSDAPLVTSSSSSVRPNIMFVLDDSGSMGWDYLPDWANSGTVSLFRNADYNGVYYDPAVRYDPPTAYNADGTLNTTTYPDMDGLTTTTGADTTTKPNWKAVPDDGYGVQSTTKSNLVGNAYFYTFIPGEYCTAPNLKTCNTQTAPSTTYPYAAKLRWCNNSAACQASYISGSYTNARYPGLTGVPGSNQRTDIVSTNNSYPYPGTSTKAASRTDCAGTTCTYAEEMNNYANWWAYYHTRMQMMKTAASIAFSTLNDSYRTSYMSINNNTSSDFLNFGTNNNTQKYNWYGKLFAANPGNRTPLREALSNAGRLYAGKYNGTTFNGSTVTDPMEYSCQQNFTILSTDGYWNGNAGFKLNGTTAVGNQDGTEPRPMYDGANTTSTRVTPTTTVVQKETVGNATTTKVWNRTITTASTTQDCNTGGGGGTGGGGSCVQDTTGRTWCMYTSTGVSKTSRCSSNMGSNTNKAFGCRLDSGLAPVDTNPDGVGCLSDGTNNWCVYTNNTTGTSCSSELQNRDGPIGVWVCKQPVGNNGYTVTTQTQTYNQVIKGSTTEVKDEATTVNETVITSNGVAGSPTYTTVQPAPSISTVSSTSSTTSDTGAPTSSTTWTNGSSATQCLTTRPTPGTSTATVASTSTAFTGTPTVTTLSTTVTVGSPTTSSSASGGTSDTLADVAEYYYVTDLRTTTNSNCTGAGGGTLCSSTSPDPYNNVPASGLDAASWQHMTTFTLGLGASGYMQYLSSTYMSDTSGDFFDVKNGTAANPSGGICAWQSSGSCNWPTPAADSQANIDDLWHAAVNGRGTYYSATNPATLAGGLGGALAGVSARTGASAAATTSNPNVTSGDNFVFSSTFTTVSWDGELVRQQLDLTTGVTSSTVDWAAQARLDANAARKIYYYSSGATGNLKEFLWSNLSSDGWGSQFTTPHISTGVDALSQFCTPGSLPTCLSAADQATASGQKVVDFLRGDRTNEGASTDLTKYYRQRTHVLGDIVNAEAVYVKNSLYNYSDFGYSSFVTTNSSRQGMVYAAANDGMLHAFYSADGRMNASTGQTVASGGIAVTGGEEAWAYVPSFVIPNLYKLADKDYSVSGHHRYLVDGTPVAGDICVSGCGTTSAVWKTILVGGLNKGGRGYYALDVTNPAAPAALWEFTDTNMGYTYGNPKITKLKNGTWVVLVTSGYNNVSPGDGQGRLYVINAATGALIRSIATGVGDTITPSGLARISAMVVNTSSDNTVLQVYGGDLRGNLWRFDVNGDVGATGYDAQRLTTVSGPSGAVQPITTKPEIGKVSGNVVVYFGTGSYLGVSDIGDTNQKSPHLQSFYAVKDPLSTNTTPATAIYSNPRSGGFVRQVQTTTTCPSGTPTSICTTGEVVRTSTNNSVNFASDNGWYIDLPDSGERANTDPTLALGTIGFTTNVPANDACSIGGYSYRYFLDYRTGGPVSSSSTGVAGTKLGNALATRPVYVRLPNNTIVELTRLSSGDTITSNVPIGSGALPTRRTSWRELTVE